MCQYYLIRFRKQSKPLRISQSYGKYGCDLVKRTTLRCVSLRIVVSWYSMFRHVQVEVSIA
jgi:hypothetical protein